MSPAKFLRILNQNKQTWNNTKKALIKVHPLILAHHKKWLVTDNSKETIVDRSLPIKLSRKQTQVLEKVCNYFHCLPIVNDTNFHIIGYHKDSWLCLRYFTFILTSITITINHHLEPHNRKAKLQRERKRAGRSYIKMIHGKAFSSNLNNKFIEEYELINNKLLENTSTYHKELSEVKRIKIKTLKQWKQNLN